MAVPRELALKVIEEISGGAGLVKTIEKHHIGLMSLFETIDNDSELQQKYARAEKVRATLAAEEITEIADTEHDAQKARNRIDARKWYASKMQPSKFGDRIDVNLNQTVDIGAALSDARKRTASLPSRYQHDAVDAEVIVPAQLTHSNVAGSEPVELTQPTETKDADAIDPVDIFS